MNSFLPVACRDDEQDDDDREVHYTVSVVYLHQSFSGDGNEV